MPRSVRLVAAAAVLLVLLAGLAAYAYFFSGLRTSPKPLALPSASAAPSGAASAADLTGSWTVSSGSEVGYRVKEQFVGQTSTHEAVARTTAVAGGLTVQAAGSGLQGTGLRFVAQVGQLHSVDQVAGYNVTNRDRFVSGTTLSTQQYPQASFQASAVTIPDSLASGQTVTVSVPGQLTIHGVTHDATATVQLQRLGADVKAAGSVMIDMTDYGISPPRVPFTTSESKVTIEFALSLARS